MFISIRERLQGRRDPDSPACTSHRFTWLPLSIVLAMVPFMATATTYNCSDFSIPGGTVQATGINKSGIVVGTYIDSSSKIRRGFIRDAAGNIDFVDYPGITSTQLFTINNNGIVAGVANTLPETNYPPYTNFTVDLQRNFNVISFPPPYNQSDHLVSIYGINDNGAISGEDAAPNGGLFILVPDGTLNTFPGRRVFPWAWGLSLNDSLQMLEPGDYGNPTTALLGPDGALTPIIWSSYPVPNRSQGISYGLPTTASGLNNGGTVVGYASFNHTARSSPYVAFERDPSGIFSEIVCPGVHVGGLQPSAINDSGVIVGTDDNGPFIATPLPGAAQLTASASSLVFPPQTVSTTSATTRITITNTGNQRLDIGDIKMLGYPGEAPSAFKPSGCVDPTTQTTSLDPGASCVLSVTFTPPPARLVDDLLIMDDSSPGSPHIIPVSGQGTAPAPSCRISAVNYGPPEQAIFYVSAYYGLASIALLNSVNASVTIPSVEPGSRFLNDVTATQVSSSEASRVDFRVTDVAGVVTNCGTTFGGPTQWTGLGGILPGKIAVVSNADGRLQAFARSADNAVWTIAQTSPDGPWSGWQNLGGVMNGDPAVGVNADGRLEVFASGTDNSLWHIWQTAGGSWSSWESLGGILTSSPAVATNADGRLEVFAVGTDQALWHIWQTFANGTWSDWNSLGGAIMSNAAVAVNQDGRLEVFVYGTNSALWHIWQTTAGGGWSEWAGLGGSLAGDPVSILNRDGRLELFGRGSDSQLWHIAQSTADGSWSDWSSLGGVLTSDPAVIANADGHLEVFARGAQLGLWHISQTASGTYRSDWESLGGVLANGVSAAINVDGRVEALAAGSDQSFWVIEQTAPGFWN